MYICFLQYLYFMNVSYSNADLVAIVFDLSGSFIGLNYNLPTKITFATPLIVSYVKFDDQMASYSCSSV